MSFLEFLIELVELSQLKLFASTDPESVFEFSHKLVLLELLE